MIYNQKEAETDEIDQIENPKSRKSIDSQHNRETNVSVDPYIELDINVAKKTELSTPEKVASKMTETPYENVDTEEKLAFDDLNIPGDYSDYNILEEEKETISRNNEVRVKTK